MTGGNFKLSCWFGLSYTSWLTVPRVLMEAMPDDWQSKMADLLNEYNQTFPNQPDLGSTVRVTRKGKIVKTPEWVLNYRHPDRSAIDELRGATVSEWNLLEWMNENPNKVEQMILAGGCCCLDCLRPVLRDITESRYTGLAFVSCSHVGIGWKVELECEEGVPIRYDVARDELPEVNYANAP